MKSVAYLFLTVLCVVFFIVSALAAAEVHFGFAVPAIAFFVGAGLCLILAVDV